MNSYGADRLIDDFTTIGYVVEKVTGADSNIYAVFPIFDIPVGKFEGKQIALGLQATPDYPNSVHSSIHVKADPQLYEPSENIANVRNVQPSGLGPDWRYWSQNFNWNIENTKTARRLMSKITRIFEHA